MQDIFPTETAGYADVILPATTFYEKWGSFTNTDRTVQLARPVLDPPGEARADLAILQAIAQRFGLAWRYDGPYHGVAAVFDEMRHAMPSIAGITWERLERDGAVAYPCRHEGDPGEAVVFRDRFPTADGRGRFVPVHPLPADERPDARLPAGADHGAPARALAHGVHDPARARPGRPGT